jgi:hypothetical protein
VLLQTHLNENSEEIAWVKELYLNLGIILMSTINWDSQGQAQVLVTVFITQLMSINVWQRHLPRQPLPNIKSFFRERLVCS